MTRPVGMKNTFRKNVSQTLKRRKSNKYRLCFPEAWGSMCCYGQCPLVACSVPAILRIEKYIGSDVLTQYPSVSGSAIEMGSQGAHSFSPGLDLSC